MDNLAYQKWKGTAEAITKLSVLCRTIAAYRRFKPYRREMIKSKIHPKITICYIREAV